MSTQSDTAELVNSLAAWGGRDHERSTLDDWRHAHGALAALDRLVGTLGDVRRGLVREMERYVIPK